ncbi:Carbohydrate binding domain-containing protein [Pseudomonas lundensis]|uniref:hypothetical protein n=1 Tax=Pseudomonas lundensis TaxID=86185 RepID=UPI000888B418|nr:hypothetical protein [Pseudomonas lundensis]SDQ80042.1 Carbohydrate binding domain-containing protein [Pseudomonas lundensis]
MSDMKVVPGIQITPANMPINALPDMDYPAYDSTTAYKIGDYVTIDRINYQALVANTNRHPVTDTVSPAAWQNMGWVNKYRMFNKNIGNTWKIGTYTSAPDVIDFTVRPGKRINAIGLVGVRASSVRIIMTVPGVTDPVYDKTFAMSLKAGGSWYQYYFGQFTTKDNLAEFDLPPFNNADIRVIVSAPGGTARVGMFVVGWGKSIGTAVYGTSLGRKKYSTLKEEFDGSMTITPRGRRKSIDFQVVLQADQISSVQRTLDDVDDMPSLYVGASELDYTVIVGIFDDFDTGLPTYNRGEYTLKVRSLM